MQTIGQVDSIGNTHHNQLRPGIILISTNGPIEEIVKNSLLLGDKIINFIHEEDNRPPLGVVVWYVLFFAGLGLQLGL